MDDEPDDTDQSAVKAAWDEIRQTVERGIRRCAADMAFDDPEQGTRNDFINMLPLKEVFSSMVTEGLLESDEVAETDKELMRGAGAMNEFVWAFDRAGYEIWFDSDGDVFAIHPRLYEDDEDGDVPLMDRCEADPTTADERMADRIRSEATHAGGSTVH